MKTSNKASVYDIVTQKILDQLQTVKAGDWSKPWFELGHGIPKNAATLKPYRGINTFLLSGSSHWATFKTWQKLDCQVKKGSKASICTFWNITERENKQTGKKEKFFMLRYYSVFSLEQVEGEHADKLRLNPVKPLNNHDVNANCEAFINGYLEREGIKTIVDDRAYYQPIRDIVAMPKLGQFNSAENYYSTYLHELVHSTGHSTRNDRKLTGQFGSEDYAKEELVAELGAAMLCAELGLSNLPRPDHAQYLKSWLKALQNDSRYIIQAASQAQKAIAFMTEASEETEEAEDSEAA